MPNLINIFPEPSFNENLYPNTKLEYTLVGSSGSSLSYSSFSVNNDSSLKLVSVSSVPTVMDLSESIVVGADGTYGVSFYFYKNNPDFEWQVALGVYINGIFSETISAELLNTSSNFVSANWNVYGQNFNLGNGDEVTFRLTCSTGSVGNVLYISAPKFELLNKKFYSPSFYTYPNIPQLTTTNLKNEKGWGIYKDSLAVPTITIGTTYTQITIDALGGNITDYLPLDIRGISDLWTGNKITPISIGDDYDGRLDLTVTAKSGSPSFIQVIIDISGSTPGANVVFTDYIQTGGTLPYDRTTIFDFYSLSTFLANGGRIYARVDSGSVTIGTRNVKISRKSKNLG